MADATPAVFDDIGASVSHLSEFGVSVVAPIARAFRESVILFAAARGWQIIHHAPYVAWATSQSNEGLTWLVLDPLFPANCLGPRAIAIRFTRVFGPGGWTLDSTFSPDVEASLRSKRVAVLDDVASNGRTFRHTAALVSDAGGTIASFAVGASTAGARSSISDAYPQAGWAQFLPGDHPTIHLRDGCPCLPFAGRRVHDRAPIITAHGSVGVRVSPAAFRGGLWEQLASDRSIQHALVSARRSLADRFSSALGRTATVGDVPLLGPNVEIPLYTKQSATADTRLESVLM